MVKTKTMFGDLTEDMAMEILLRLPIKDLKRVKLVCKSLKSLINSSEFKAQRSLNLNRETYILISAYSIGTNMFSGGPTKNLQLQLEGLRFKSHCCCEGVLFVETPDSKFALWNPATGDFKPIPFDIDEMNYYDSYYEDLRVDKHGCVFDSKHNEYKPLFVLSSCVASAYGIDGWNMYDREIHIYSYKTNRWKIIKSYGIESFGGRDTVYADGICHWVAFSVDIGREVVISFDINNEVIITTPFPDDIIHTYKTPNCPYLLPFNDSSFALVKRHRSNEHYIFDNDDDVNTIATSFIHQRKIAASFDIWVLGEYGNKDSWTKLFTIEPPKGIEHLLGFWNQTKVFLSDHKTYQIVGDKWTRESDGKLLLYDTVTRQTLELQSIEPRTVVLTCRQRLLPIVEGITLLFDPLRLRNPKKKIKD